MNLEKIQCVGFIMDGNRRWATSRGLPSIEGHRNGYEALERIIQAVHDANIPHMVCYAFSTENWKRSNEEVAYLMGLLDRALTELINGKKHGGEINLRIIGEIDRLSEDMQTHVRDAHARNVDTPELTVWVALSYGGRAEILQAVNKAVASGTAVTEQDFVKLLWTTGMPDPDLIIRTSGELRLSNFLTWQSVYSEFFFTDTLWPDFGEVEFQSILQAYDKRKRRIGA